MIVWLAITVACLLTAAVSAVLGMGGGVALLALMAAVLPAADVVPLHGVVQLCSNATRMLAFLRHVCWPIFFVFTPAAALGVLLATQIWSGQDFSHVKPAVGAFIWAFLILRRYKPRVRNVSRWVFAPVGVVAGLLTIFVGATGPFVAPFFLRDDMTKEEVIATKAALQWVGHAFKLPAFLALGYDYRPTLGWLVVLVAAVVVGTLLGKRILSKLSTKLFLLLFEGVLAIAASFLLASAFR